MECNASNNGAKLLDAATEDRADDVVEILEKCPTLVHIADPMGDTAFHVAARAGHGSTVLKMIEFLENNHSEALEEVLCEGNTYGDTPLHIALRNGHKYIVNCLAIAERSAIFMMNDDQESPVDLADRVGIELSYLFVPPDEEKSMFKKALLWFTNICKSGENDDQRLSLLSLEKIEWLEEPSSQFSDISMRLVWPITSDNDADDDDDDDDDEEEEESIKLYKAAKYGKEDLVMEILENDPKTLEYKDPIWGGTALHAAARNGRVCTLNKMVEFIMENNNCDDLERLLLEGDDYDSTPLHLALEGGYEKVARYLVEVAPRAIYKVDRQGLSPLCLAIDKGYTDLVRYMTRSDLCQSIREQLFEHAKKVSILHITLKNRNLAVLQAILEGLPDLIYVPDKRGWKVLSYVASKGYLDEVSYILKRFPDSARKIDEDDSFPIHKAIVGGHIRIVKELLLCCPQALKDVDRKGRNLVDYATLYQGKNLSSLIYKVENN